jgi:GNAT superfamily N-acetyltransferase
LAILIGSGMEWRHGDYVISTDPKRVDVATVHRFLTASYWAAGIPIDVVRRSVEHSLCFGVYKGGRQAGFARVITDYATFAYIGDVFILEEHRGLGLSKWLLSVIREHPDLQGLRRWMLATRDAHTLYSRFGFTPLNKPETWMEIRDYDVYRGV